MIHPAKNRWDLPQLGFGLGLRTPHYGEILGLWPELGFFEIISENFMQTGGRPLWVLDQVAERYPVVMHGVSLSIGSPDALDMAYLKELKALVQRCRAPWLGDHVCWTGVQGLNTHDLLPLPYTEAVLRHVVAKVRQAQDVLERPLILENPSTYLSFQSDEMPEWEFIRRLAEDADCGILLDVNNIYVSHRNHGFDPDDYMAALPWDRVVQIHLSGHTDKGSHCIDTHDHPVCDSVWSLYEEAMARQPGASTLLEWDAHIPAFAQVSVELAKAESRLGKKNHQESERSAREIG